MMWVVLVLLGRGVEATTGESSCPCVEFYNFGSKVSGGHLKFRPAGSSVTYDWPPDYGILHCKAWDSGLSPFCDKGTGSPRWCSMSWCYVDAARCTGTTYSRGVVVPELAFSYETCGESSSQADWQTDVIKMFQLISTVEGHLRNSRDAVEATYLTLSLEGCTLTSTCNCQECYERPGFRWTDKVDFHRVGETPRLPTSTQPDDIANDNVGKCMGQAIGGTFKKVGASESLETSKNRGGFMYYGDQTSGSLTTWPSMDFCPAVWDARRRPWYAAGSTGPKDVLIIVDVSGSMTTANRHTLAREATKALLRTLVWKDFATIILFNHELSAVYSEILVAVDETTRGDMMAWVDKQPFTTNGGTNFKTPMDKAFEILRKSTREWKQLGLKMSRTSMCQKAIMFLTDGMAAFDDSDFRRLKENSKEYDAYVFTYTIGNSAEESVAKKMACQNRGVYYKVPDGADLTSVMAQYFAYFAQGQQVCVPSFVEYDILGSTLGKVTAGCLPIYDRSSGRRKLLGTVCMDAGIIFDPWRVKEEPSWDMAVCKMSDMTKMCRPLELQECDRQKIRLQYNAMSVCEDSTGSIPSASAVQNEVCKCVDSDCKDNPTFIGEDGSMCDAWVGDDCQTADTVWGYSAAGKAAVIQECKRSCGLCDRVACSSQAPACDEDSTQFLPCRKCAGAFTTGVDLRGCEMQCPTFANFSCAKPSSGDERSIENEGGNSTPVFVFVFCGIPFLLLILGMCAFFLKRLLARDSTRRASRIHPSPVRPPAMKAAVVGRADMVPLPKTWKNQSLTGDFNTLEPVPEMLPTFSRMFNDTFKKVSTRDRRGARMPDSLEVVMVSRIENPNLFQAYAQGLKRISRKRPHKCTPLVNTRGGDVMTKACAGGDMWQDLNGNTNEVLLWHGTSPQGAMGIANEGFRLDLSGTAAGSMFWKGIYFAESCSKSDEYAKDDSEGLYKGLFCLLLCRVNLGELLTMTTGGNAVHGLIKSAMDSGSYDSVLGDREASVGTYREFIVYREDQVYPEYLVLYRRH